MKMPLMLDVVDKKVLIVGGGQIGYRKAMNFLHYGAAVTCLSKVFNDAFQDSNVQCIEGSYSEGILKDYDIVVASTDDVLINGDIYRDAQYMSKLCMTVDRENPSDFSHMAIGEKRHLTLCVSTQGGSPGFSKKIVNALLDRVTEEEYALLEEMIQERKERLK